MKIGFIGLGKLGLPVATAIAMRGYEVVGYDHNAARMTKEPQRHKECGPLGDGDFNDHLATTANLSFAQDIAGLSDCGLIFVAVQTPHEPEFEGATPLPLFRKDFDYTYLRASIRELVETRSGTTTPATLVIISTCLPGTIRREIMPLLEGTNLRIVYNPFFIAMGQVLPDFYAPEFVLIGADNKAAADELDAFYFELFQGTKSAHPTTHIMSIESAELTKVAYNTYIGSKIVFANTVMELSHLIPRADTDEVMAALKDANRRLISTAYLDGGMGDGGGCHPRDNIAMSWLASRLGLSANIFESLMRAREQQTDFIARLVFDEHQRNPRLPVAVVGIAFKPGTNLCDGSPALLLIELLRNRGVRPEAYDCYVDNLPDWPDQAPRIYIVGCRHQELAGAPVWAGPGSIIIDPWRITSEQELIHVIRIGRGSERTH